MSTPPCQSTGDNEQISCEYDSNKQQSTSTGSYNGLKLSDSWRIT